MINRSETILYSGWTLAVLLTLAFLTFGQTHWYSAGRQDQLAHDVARLEKTNYNIVPVNTITAFNGRFEGFEKGVLTFNNTDMPSNPLLDDYPRVRHALINSNTQIILRQAKTLANFNSEVTRARLKKSTEPVLPYTETILDISKIQMGADIQVIASQPGMSYQESFAASKIIVNPSPSFVQSVR